MKINIATNNGDMGGGEVMLLNIARAVRKLGHDVVIIGPSEPNTLIQAAHDEGFSTVTLPAKSRRQYMVQLRAWSARRPNEEILWCNGLVPSAATIGLKNRIVHLHQVPEGLHNTLAKFAKKKALRVLVPSEFAASLVPGSEPFYNWVDPVTLGHKKSAEPGIIKIGFLGRPSDFKGTQFVAQAVYQLNKRQENIRYQLVIGGESRFVPEDETKELAPALEQLGEDLIELGWTTTENYFSQIDIATVPSNWDEVFGLVTAETMSASKPLIVSDAGALPEVVGNGYPYIFERADTEKLIEMIQIVTQQILEDSPLLEETINTANWRWQEFFSPSAGKNRVEELINSLK